MTVWEGSEWKWDFKWRRNWFAWEHEVVEAFHLLLKNVQVHLQKEDKWVWLKDGNGEYSVSSSYKSLHELLYISQPNHIFFLHVESKCAYQGDIFYMESSQK